MEDHRVQSPQTFQVKKLIIIIRRSSSYKRWENMRIGPLWSKFWWQITVLKQLLRLTCKKQKKMVCIITLMLNPTFGMIGKAMGIEIIVKVVSKKASFHFSVKN